LIQASLTVERNDALKLKLDPDELPSGAIVVSVFGFATVGSSTCPHVVRWNVSMVGRRLRSRAALELENLAPSSAACSLPPLNWGARLVGARGLFLASAQHASSLTFGVDF